MTLNINILNKNNVSLPEINKKGDWFEIYAGETVSFKAPTIKDNTVHFDAKTINLGFCVQLPKGYEAYICVRSSLYEKKKVILTNSKGIIDNSYSGENDLWKVKLLAFDKAKINKGEKILQFRIQLSQYATCWQKLCWLFTNKVKLNPVEKLSGESRGGFGSTGGYNE